MALQIRPLLILFTVFIIDVTPGSGIKGKFVQINDIHYDPTYLTTGDSCNVELPKASRFKYGNYDCDSSLLLTESALYKVDQESSIIDTDFIIWAGDIVTHTRRPDMLNEQKILDIINTTALLMKERVRSGVPIFPMLGNHDYFPKNQLPDNPDGNELYEKIADILCPLFIGKEPCTLFRQGGYYSVVLDNKVKVIITNSNLYSVNNKAIPDGDNDPAMQFDWLRKELEKTRQENQKAHVFAHIPPGMLETAVNVKMFKDNYNTEFVQILRDYDDVIIGVYSAHTHTDSFRIIYSKEKKPMVSLLISPAVTPWRWVSKTSKAKDLPRNPALRSVHYEATSPHTLKDYAQFYLPLDTANKAIEGETVRWEEEYHFTRTYTGVSDLSPPSLHKLVTQFRVEANNDFHRYFDLNSVSIHTNDDKPMDGKYYCSCACKERHICSIVNVDYEDYHKCMAEVERSQTCAGCRLGYFLWLPVVALLVSLRQFV